MAHGSPPLTDDTELYEVAVSIGEELSVEEARTRLSEASDLNKGLLASDEPRRMSSVAAAFASGVAQGVPGFSRRTGS
jgi:hypothetical protein